MNKYKSIKKILVFTFLSLFPVVAIISAAESYDNEVVHPSINENAAKQSASLLSTLRNIGFNNGLDNVIYGKKVYKWFHEGARLEDETVCRSRNHFHDPLKTWDSAGLNNIAINTLCIGLGEPFGVDSSIIWAQKQPGMLFTKNFWSWPKARAYYYDALTKSKKDERDVFFAQTFRALGQVMHLIADSSVPAHVRNDIHIFPLTIPIIGIDVGRQTYESWAKTHWSKLTYSGFTVDQSIFTQSIYNSSAPVPITALWDQDKYNGANPNVTREGIIGLAEYTNANFFSEDTIFRDYPNPARENTNFSDFDLLPITVITTPGNINHNAFYIRGYGKEHLAGLKYFSKEITESLDERFRLELMLDNRCYEDYAKLLLPRAVGYSAGLLNYFFRGDIRLEYVTTPEPGYVIVNNTGEKMEGDFTIYYDTANDERYPVWAGKGTLEATIGDKTNTFDFIPPGDAKEPGKYILVFKGKMGKEDGAVAGYVLQRLLEITPPERFLYSIADADQTDPYFTSIKAKVRNASPSEAMQNGVIQAIAKYKTDIDDVDFIYSMSAPRSITSLAPDQSTEFEFNFSNDPIPVDVTDLYLQVIFKGTIGNENNAVVIGLKDISEPTPIDLFNNMDRACIKGSWYTAGSQEVITTVDTDATIGNHNGRADEWDVYTHNVKDIYIKLSPYDKPQNASPDNYDFYVESLPAGQFKRVLYILTDYKFSYSFYDKWIPIAGEQDPWAHVDEMFTYQGTAMKNQTDLISDPQLCGNEIPCLYTTTASYYPYRGSEMWWGGGLIYVNKAYPEESSCP